MRVLLLVLLCTLLASSQPAQAAPKAKKIPAKADLVVIAELIRGSQGMPHCGVMAVVGEFEFRVILVEKGKLESKRIVVEALCPEMSMENYHLSRLELSVAPRNKYRPAKPLKKPPAKRLYLVSQKPFDFEYTTLLGTSLTSLSAQFTKTGARNGWLHFGPGLSVQTSDTNVSTLRLAIPRGFPSSFAWLGLPKITWKRFSRRGGYPKGIFTGPDGIAGNAERGYVEFTRSGDAN
tara:strand:+ start:57169 stop:57873 length:705 start_codon:yes stop_codon:yes gene_type:complete